VKEPSKIEQLSLRYSSKQVHKMYEEKEDEGSENEKKTAVNST